MLDLAWTLLALAMWAAGIALGWNLALGPRFYGHQAQIMDAYDQGVTDTLADCNCLVCQALLSVRSAQSPKSRQDAPQRPE